ncbi:MAG TPA: zinc-binding dehydrogenase [Acidimicrobiia bacterium]|nr:zinc-binding dehydrogenase [Acidimicrobiia bacterium]
MKALVFRNNLPRQAATKLGSFVTPKAFAGRLAPVQLENIAEPIPPGSDWAVCDTIVSGLCGSDTKQIFLDGARDNSLTALISFPHVLGHEAVARRRDTGTRIVLNPWLSCAPRGIEPPCPACADGRYPQCRNFTRGRLPPSLHLGNCAGAGGTHAEAFAAHHSQLVAIPDDVTDDAAVLSDPAGVSLHAILQSPPDPRRPALVYGCGTLGLAAIALLRLLYPDVEVWAVSRPGRPAELATKLGAAHVLPAAPDELVERVASMAHCDRSVPWSGKAWLQDGPGVVYDMVGSPETMETALRLVDTGGHIVVVGVEPPGRFEWTPLYFKEVHVIGSNAFGVEEVRGIRKHSFEHYFDFVRGGLDLTPLITHRFPLTGWQDAVLAVAHQSTTGSIKVLIQPDGM